MQDKWKQTPYPMWFLRRGDSKSSNGNEVYNCWCQSLIMNPLPLTKWYIDYWLFFNSILLSCSASRYIASCILHACLSVFLSCLLYLVVLICLAGRTHICLAGRTHFGQKLTESTNRNFQVRVLSQLISRIAKALINSLWFIGDFRSKILRGYL